MHRRETGRRIGLEPAAARAGAEEHLIEAHERRDREERGVRVVELPQRFRGTRLGVGEVLRQIIHFLDEARAHLVVVLVEPERECLAIQHLVANRGLDERIELRGRRLTALQHRGRGARLRDLLRRDDDRIASSRDGLAAPSLHH